MKLSDYEFLPGIIIDVEDPKKIGRVKATVPTWFDNSVLPVESLPWIYPLKMSGYQTFSKMENGRKIWVLHNNTNYEEYWYIPMFELHEQTKEIIDQYTNSDVLVSRTLGESGNVKIYYNDNDGIMISVGESKINITPNKEIHITDNDSYIKIIGGNISIGRDEQQEPAIMGKTTKEMLQKLGGDITNIGYKMAANPYVSAISDTVISCGNDLQSKCNDILSDIVTISK